MSFTANVSVVLKTALLSQPPCFGGTKSLGEGNKGILIETIEKNKNKENNRTLIIFLIPEEELTLWSHY
jgi:hypothetical protein